MGMKAYRLANRGAARDDAKLIRRAIRLADQAEAYLEKHDISNKIRVGRLTRTYQVRWKNWLEDLQ